MTTLELGALNVPFGSLVLLGSSCPLYAIQTGFLLAFERRFNKGEELFANVGSA
jgi:hypothetical protein